MVLFWEGISWDRDRSVLLSGQGEAEITTWSLLIFCRMHTLVLGTSKCKEEPAFCHYISMTVATVTMQHQNTHISWV